MGNALLGRLNLKLPGVETPAFGIVCGHDSGSLHVNRNRLATRNPVGIRRRVEVRQLDRRNLGHTVMLGPQCLGEVPSRSAFFPSSDFTRHPEVP